MKKYMLIMRSSDAALEAGKDVDFEEIINAMGAYNESLVNAGVLLGGEGRTDPSEGFVVDFPAEEPLVTDGPYGEPHELWRAGRGPGPGGTGRGARHVAAVRRAPQRGRVAHHGGQAPSTTTYCGWSSRRAIRRSPARRRPPSPTAIPRRC